MYKNQHKKMYILQFLGKCPKQKKQVTGMHVLIQN